ncbi:MAG: PVC-type heme-binding CxxCH protein [Isosphaeraceae bacterium]
MSDRNPPRAALAARSAAGTGTVVLALLVASLAPPSARAQVSARESAAKVKPAEGLEATLWASEPLVVNPTNMDVDARGRVWITEGLNYRLTHGSKPFKKIEDADKIKILEDTDGDGKADKMTVFADKIYPIPMGLAVEERYGPDGTYQGCKVYVGNSPDLLVLEDTDGDDKADTRYSLLTGFGGVDSDHGVHGMVLGLDGKLYFTHGDGCCSFEQSTGRHDPRNFDVVDRSGRHVSSDQLANTLRVNRDGTQFEVLADRQRNNYETSLNAFGNVFTSDNDDDGNRGSRVIWVMDGGKYGYRTPGSPRHWGEEVPGNVPKLVGTGNGSPCGIMVYEGSLLPGDYQGGLFEADAGTRQINFFPLTRQGASFRTDYKVLLGSDDPWFRPVDMTAAPDGAILVADWYDGGVGGHAFKDQTTGRIYRVAPKGNKPSIAKPDFGTIPGLIAALKSPVVAAQDAARRSLIERATADREPTVKALVALFQTGQPVEQARALWVLHAIQGDQAARDALAHADPRIREQAVRMLGRDCRDVGKVEYGDPAAKLPPPAVKHLGVLLPMANDPDAGVRRELILALRNVVADQAGDALLTLARTWDGQDRWYLEALGLALEDRESGFVSQLFDGSLYGDLELARTGEDGQVALPPYFPVDRNEAYIPAGTGDPPANALSKTLGLAWRLHRNEVLPLLSRILPALEAPELQQAADDVLSQMRGVETAVFLAELASRTDDPSRKRQILGTLGDKLDGVWSEARRRPEILGLAEAALKDSDLRLEAVALAAATGDRRFAPDLTAMVGEKGLSDELKARAVESVARLNAPGASDFLNGVIDATRGKSVAPSTAEAAVRSLARVGDAPQRLVAILEEPAYPASLRGTALRTLARLGGGPDRLLALVRDGKLAEELKGEASTILNTLPDRRIRDAAAAVLPPPRTRGGKPLPPFFDLVRGEGNAERGQEVFFRAGANGCATCHRVRGRGQWIGPDLSTIGTKYGRDELLRSILSPSAAIGYNFRSLIVALDDGRVVNGLPVEDSPDRLVLKTADGQRVIVRPSQVEERQSSDVSLMPEGLVETLEDTEIIDLLTFLATLRQPVSIVGQYQAIGPVAETEGSPALDPSRVDLSAPVRGPDGEKLVWRRLTANAESLVDLTTLAGGNASQAAYLHAPVVSPVAQRARLVLDSPSDPRVWLNGKALDLPSPGVDSSRAVTLELPAGRSELLIRVAGGPGASLVTTFVTEKPVAFVAEGTKVSDR